MKITAAVFGLLVVLIVGWSQRGYIGTELGITSGSGALLQVDTSRIVTRRVWAGPGVDLSGTPSPDGTLLSHTDWTTGDLAVRNLVTGESRRLTNKGPWSESEAMALSSVISRDGQRVAYTWVHAGWEIRVIGIDGSGERVVVPGGGQPYDWSPDGRDILVSLGDTTGAHRLGVVSARGGRFRALTTLRDGESPSRATFSPDGGFVVFDDRAESGPPQSDIYVVSIEGGRRQPLVEHPAHDNVLGWSPDGSTILFASDRTGSQAAWLIPVENGRAAGKPVLVKSDLWRADGLGFTRDGAFVYGIQVGTGDVYVASVDVASGRVLASPAAASQHFVGSNSAPAWSSDGQYLAYVSRQGPGPIGTGSVIVIRSLATGDERTIDPQLKSYLGLRWSPDGRFLVTAATDVLSRRGIFVIDAQTGATRPLGTTPPGEVFMSPDWVAGGTAVVYVHRSWSANRDRIVRHDLASDEVTELVGWSMDAYWGYVVAASSNGDSIAFVQTDAKAIVPTIYVMSADGGPKREVVRLPARKYVPWDLNWTPDGSHLLYVTRSPSDPGPLKIWAVATAGGEPYRIGIEDVHLNQLRIHPDGRRIAYRAGEDQQEVWVMENFLPSPQPDR